MDEVRRHEAAAAAAALRASGATLGWGLPATNAHAIRLLARHGVLDEATAGSVASAVGFRNVLGHG